MGEELNGFCQIAWRGVAWRGVACGMSSSNVTSGALKLATWRQKRLDDTSHNGKKQAYLVCLVQDGLGGAAASDGGAAAGVGAGEWRQGPCIARVSESIEWCAGSNTLASVRWAGAIPASNEHVVAKSIVKSK